MSQRFEGRNLEEALQHAAQALAVERWQLTYHVLMEKRGFLGGVKRVVIEADVNIGAAPPAVAAAPPPFAEARSPRADRGPRRGGRSGGGGRREGGHSREGGRGRRGNRDRELRSGDFESFLVDVPEQGPESDAATVAREWIENVIALSGLDLVLRTDEKDEQIIIRLYGSDGARLTDKHGELLDAIQVLANKALVLRRVEKEIELDCEEFKDRREEDLGRRAREVADRVRRGGREELLPAMTPIERRIVHIALRDDSDVTTESRGEGFYKRVAIILRPEGEQTANAAGPSTPES